MTLHDPGVILHTWNLSALQVETGWLEVQSIPSCLGVCDYIGLEALSQWEEEKERQGLRKCFI